MEKINVYACICIELICKCGYKSYHEHERYIDNEQYGQYSDIVDEVVFCPYCNEAFEVEEIKFEK